MEVLIISDELENDDLIAKLEARPELATTSLSLRKTNTGFRGLEPTVLVALITGGTAVLTALVNQLLTIAHEARKKEILIRQAKDGKEVEVRLPVGASQEDLDKAVEVLEKLDNPRIVV